MLIADSRNVFQLASHEDILTKVLVRTLEIKRNPFIPVRIECDEVPQHFMLPLPTSLRLQALGSK